MTSVGDSDQAPHTPADVDKILAAVSVGERKHVTVALASLREESSMELAELDLD